VIVWLPSFATPLHSDTTVYLPIHFCRMPWGRLGQDRCWGRWVLRSGSYFSWLKTKHQEIETTGPLPPLGRRPLPQSRARWMGRSRLVFGSWLAADAKAWRSVRACREVFSFQFSVFSFQFSVFSFQFSVFSFQFSVFSQLPTANCQLPTANCQLPTANCLLLTAYC
jgi:hypothetical protein